MAKPLAGKGASGHTCGGAPLENLRQRIAREMARYFLAHLNEEMGKSADLMDKPHFGHRTPREVNRGLLDRLHREFPGIEKDPPPPFNFIREWVRRNRFLYRYEDYAFDIYNRIFVERVVAFQDTGAAASEKFMAEIERVFGEFDFEQAGFSISFFIRVENNMRELLREMMLALPGVDPGKAWELIFEQSKDYQEAVNKVFEGRLKAARDESERLLRNILPQKIAEELKKNQQVEPVWIPAATVLFTDFKDFTRVSQSLSPRELLGELDACFSLFDDIAEKYGLEKIKTIGDAYMCAGGIPEMSATHGLDVALASLEMVRVFGGRKEERQARGEPHWGLRIGFHSGPVIAGVISKKKFSYDVWGDTVNTASRMESSGEDGRVNVSQASAEVLVPFFDLESRGFVGAKGLGEVEMYYLKGLKKDFHTGDGFTPNDDFWAAHRALKEG